MLRHRFHADSYNYIGLTDIGCDHFEHNLAVATVGTAVLQPRLLSDAIMSVSDLTGHSEERRQQRRVTGASVQQIRSNIARS